MVVEKGWLFLLVNWSLSKRLSLHQGGDASPQSGSEFFMMLGRWRWQNSGQQYMVDEPPQGQPMKRFSKEPKEEMDGSGKYGDANTANILIINLNPDEKTLGRSIGWCHYSIRLWLCRLLWGCHRSNYIMDNGLLIRGRYSNSWF